MPSTHQPAPESPKRGKPTEMRLSVPEDTPGGFRLDVAVCSYGYFLLAPNVWEPQRRRLHRLMRDAAGRPVLCRLDQPGGAGAPVRVRCDRSLGRRDVHQVRAGLRRMLRLDEDLSGWFAVAPPEARARGFGRLIRSPTFFEDAVKTITGCNVAWPNTIRMNALLCEAFGDGAFPEPMQLAHVEPERVKQQTKVGYRAGRIVALARLIHEGALKPTELAEPELPTDELLQRLKQLPGIGPYAAANLCQLLGRYEPLAIDTETYRHFRQHLGVPTPDNPKHLHPAIDARYAPYAPYQFLAYWFELWVAYERAVGPAVTWEPSEHGQRLTGRLLEGTPAPNDDAG